jgi:hypothetical protein
MLLTDVKLFLPITEGTVTRLMDESNDLAAEVMKLSLSELCALLALQYLPKFPLDNVIALTQRALAQSIDACSDNARVHGLQSLAIQFASRLERLKIAEGFRLAQNHAIQFLDDISVSRKHFLDSNQRWDSTFAERHKTYVLQEAGYFVPSEMPGLMLTPEQGRVFQIVRGDLNEHLHVQGYAGCGKSYVIRTVLTMLLSMRARVLVLAERWLQVKMLIAGFESAEGSIDGKTFGQLAGAIIPNNLTMSTHLRMRRASRANARVDDEKYIEHFNIQASSRFSPRDIVRAAHATVTGWCSSGDAHIEVEHLPAWVVTTFDEVTKSLVVHFAREFWSATLRPPLTFEPPIRGYHQIKYAALNGWRIPERYTHVVIDECHNLSKAVLQILDGSRQAVISLGDEFQRLRGRLQRRDIQVRQREITQSVRSGTAVAPIVNTLIHVHPSKTKDEFKGNPFSRMKVEYYDHVSIPTEAATIVVTDNWGLFEWAQRLASAPIAFALLSDGNDLNTFVQDCIELYHRKIRGRHRELFKYSSWNELAGDHHGDSGFQRIEKLLTRGYDHNAWSKTFAQFGSGAPTKCLLGRVEDLRNQEYDTVMITPDALSSRGSDGRSIAEISSGLYVAVTRARRKLVAPKELSRWINEMATRRPHYLAIG